MAKKAATRVRIPKPPKAKAEKAKAPRKPRAAKVAIPEAVPDVTRAASSQVLFEAPAVSFDAPAAPPVQQTPGVCSGCSRPLNDMNTPHVDGICGICNPPKKAQKSVVPRP